MLTNYEQHLGNLKPCVNCPHIGEHCFGGNMSACEFRELVAWCIGRKTLLGFTNAKIAELSGISIHTINKVFSGSLENCNRDTIVAIVRTLIDPTGEKPFRACPLIVENAFGSAESEKLQRQIAELTEENLALKQQLSEADSKAEFRVSRALEDKAKSVAHLKEQIAEYRAHGARREKTIRTLSVLLGITVAALIALLLADLLVPSMGWLRF